MALVPKDITSDVLEGILGRGVAPIFTEWVAQSIRALTVLPIEPYLVQRLPSIVPDLEGSREPDSRVEPNDGTTISRSPGPPAPDAILSSAEADLDNVSEISVALRLGSPLTAQTSVPPEPENGQSLKEPDSQQADETLSEPENQNELSLEPLPNATEERPYREYAGSKRYFFTEADRTVMRTYLEHKVRWARGHLSVCKYSQLLLLGHRRRAYGNVEHVCSNGTLKPQFMLISL